MTGFCILKRCLSYDTGNNWKTKDNYICLQSWFWMSVGALHFFLQPLSMWALFSRFVQVPLLGNWVPRWWKWQMPDILRSGSEATRITSAIFHWNKQIIEWIRFKGTRNRFYLLMEGLAMWYCKRACGMGGTVMIIFRSNALYAYFNNLCCHYN